MRQRGVQLSESSCLLAPVSFKFFPFLSSSFVSLFSLLVNLFFSNKTIESNRIEHESTILSLLFLTIKAKLIFKTHYEAKLFRCLVVGWSN